MISKTITLTGARYACAGPRLWPTAGNGMPGAAETGFAGSGVAVLAHDRAAAVGTQIVRTVPMSARVDFRSAKPARPPRGAPR